MHVKVEHDHPDLELDKMVVLHRESRMSDIPRENAWDHLEFPPFENLE